jgi:hypothetical protein
MSTGELLNQIQALPTRERQRFLLTLLKLEGGLASGKAKNGRVKWLDVEAGAKRIFGDRVLPNLVLLERQEEAIGDSIDNPPCDRGRAGTTVGLHDLAAEGAQGTGGFGHSLDLGRRG